MNGRDMAVITTSRDHSSSPSTVAVLRIAGQMDISAAPHLRDVLERAAADGSHDVVVDLAEVTFIDCSGLRPLLEARARCGDRFRLSGVTEPVARLLRLTDLDGTFGVLQQAAGSSAGAGEQSEQILVEQAKGLLMSTHRCDADQAWRLLASACNDHHVLVGDLAAALTAAVADGADVPAGDGMAAAVRALTSHPSADADRR